MPVVTDQAVEPMGRFPGVSSDLAQLVNHKEIKSLGISTIYCIHHLAHLFFLEFPWFVTSTVLMNRKEIRHGQTAAQVHTAVFELCRQKHYDVDTA